MGKNERKKPDPEIGMRVAWMSPQFKSETIVFNERYGGSFLTVGSIRPSFSRGVSKEKEDYWIVTLRKSDMPIIDSKGEIVEFNWSFLRPIDWQETTQ